MLVFDGDDSIIDPALHYLCARVMDLEPGLRWMQLQILHGKRSRVRIPFPPEDDLNRQFDAAILEGLYHKLLTDRKVVMN